MNEVERAVLDRIDFDGLLQALDRLVQIASLSGVARRSKSAEGKRPFSCKHSVWMFETWPIDFTQLQHHPAYTAEIARTTGLGVVRHLRWR